MAVVTTGALDAVGREATEAINGWEEVQNAWTKGFMREDDW